MKLTKTKLKQIIREEIQKLNEGVELEKSSILKIQNIMKKTLGVDNVNVKKGGGRGRAEYTFRADGKKQGLYIDVAYDGLFEIYTVKANGDPKDNYWKLPIFGPDDDTDIEDEKTAIKIAGMMIKKHKKFLMEK